MAHALGISLSGPRSYEGKMQEFAWVNAVGRKDIGPVEIDKSIRVLWVTWFGMLALALSFTIVCLL
jgi:adenosylcobinamide-phosphate synthase